MSLFSEHFWTSWARPEFWSGVSLILGGTVTQNVGLGLMKLAHLRNNKLPIERRSEYWKDRSWWLALSLFIAGALCDFASLGLIPATLALPLGGLGLSVSGLFAERFLGEKFTRRDKIGTFMIIVGSWSAVIFSNKTDGDFTAEDLLYRSLDLSHAPGLYLVLCGMWLVALLFIRRHMVPNALISSVIPASLGAFGNIGGKGCAELIKMSVRGANQFGHPFTYVFIALAVFFLLAQNHYLQSALAHYDQVIVVPVYYVSVCLFSVLGGILYFGELSEASPFQILLFCFGISVVFGGVYFLTKDHLTSQNLYTLLETTDGPILKVSDLDVEDAFWDDSEAGDTKFIETLHGAPSKGSIRSTCAWSAPQNANKVVLKNFQKGAFGDELSQVSSMAIAQARASVGP